LKEFVPAREPAQARRRTKRYLGLMGRRRSDRFYVFNREKRSPKRRNQVYLGIQQEPSIEEKRKILKEKLPAQVESSP